jgi:Putative Actinobacterial Holin-X, holin superfamily III
MARMTGDRQMVRSETPEPVGADQSLGDLVALAAKDVSQLIRYEIDLAKTELRGDMKRVGLAAALAGVAAFVGCLVLVLLCIALAFGLVALGIWTWAAFLIVAGTCVLLAGAAVGIAILRLKGLSGLKRTRKSFTEGIGILRRDSQEPAVSANGDHPELSRDGQQPQIAARESR